MSDPRLPDIEAAAQALPTHSALIYRHFGAQDRLRTAKRLRQICFSRDCQFLIGNDPELAIACGADGVHFAQSAMDQTLIWRARCPNLILTCAVHDAASLYAAQTLPLDALVLSCLFKSDSPSAKPPFGIAVLSALIKTSKHPIIALGGINSANCAPILGTGAAGIAGVSGIVQRT